MPTASATSNTGTTANILDIPTEPETWPSFCQRLESLVDHPDTHAYVDASFLMWLTQVGTQSRAELFDWFRRAMPNRIHVPIWAAHGYIKHDVHKTVLKNFRKKTPPVFDNGSQRLR